MATKLQADQPVALPAAGCGRVVEDESGSGDHAPWDVSFAKKKA